MKNKTINPIKKIGNTMASCTLAILLSLLSIQLSAQVTLGTYPNTSVVAGKNTTVTPNAIPSPGTKTTATTNTNFTGVLSVNPADGVVTVTDAKQQGVYPITVKAFNGALSATTTFTLTVTDPCGQCSFTSGANVTSSSHPYALAIGDFDNNGIQDIAAPNYLSNNVSIRLGNGFGGFTSPSPASVLVGTNPASIAVGDFNGDGKQDIVTGNYNANTISIRLGFGDGTFLGTTNINVGSKPSSVAVGDFNNDGAQDIAVANYVGNNLSILIGNGNGIFTADPNVSVGLGPQSVVVGNFNGDSFQDLATANYNANTVSIRLGSATGFVTTPNIPVGDHPVTLAIGNFNGDAFQDIAVANINTTTVSIRLGNGSGSFTSPLVPELNVGVGPTSVAIGDYNGDGYQDIATSVYGANSISIMSGDGNASFTECASLTSGMNPNFVVVGDFNNDGTQDIATANYSSDNISVRLGVGTPPTVTTITSQCSYSWGCNGVTYSTSGTYTCTNIVGNCIVIDTLQLTLLQGALTVTNQVGCGAYTWAYNGITYTQSGDYDVIMMPCDTMRLHLTIIPSLIQVNVLAVSPTCHAGNDGSIDLIISGGIPPYTFLWDDSSTTSYQNNLKEAKYYYIITDNVGCVKYDSVELTGPLSILISDSLIPPSVLGGNDGLIYINASNGIGLTYSINNGTSFQSSNVFDSLTEDTYFIIVKDSFGCTKSTTSSLIAQLPTSLNNTDGKLVHVSVPFMNAITSWSSQPIGASVNLDTYLQNYGPAITLSEISEFWTKFNSEADSNSPCRCKILTTTIGIQPTPSSFEVTHTEQDRNSSTPFYTKGQYGAALYRDLAIDQNGHDPNTIDDFTGLGLVYADFVLTCLDANNVAANCCEQIIDVRVRYDHYLQAKASEDMLIIAPHGAHSVSEGGAALYAVDEYVNNPIVVPLGVIHDNAECEQNSSLNAGFIKALAPFAIDCVTAYYAGINQSTLTSLISSFSTVAVTPIHNHNGSGQTQSVSQGMSFSGSLILYPGVKKVINLVSNSNVYVYGYGTDPGTRYGHFSAEAEYYSDYMMSFRIRQNNLPSCCIQESGAWQLASVGNAPFKPSNLRNMVGGFLFPYNLSSEGGPWLNTTSSTFPPHPILPFIAPFMTIVSDAGSVLGAGSCDSLTLNILNVKQSCYNNSINGSITIDGSGGQPFAPTSTCSYIHYNCVLIPPIGNSINSCTPATFSGLSAGTYTITITDYFGNSVTTNVILTTAPALSITNVIINSDCNGSSGSIMLDASGGIGPFKYAINSGLFQNSALFENLGSGSFVFSIKDINECITTSSAILTSDTVCDIFCDHFNTIDPGWKTISNGIEVASTSTFSPIRIVGNVVNFNGVTGVTDDRVFHEIQTLPSSWVADFDFTPMSGTMNGLSVNLFCLTEDIIPSNLFNFNQVLKVSIQAPPTFNYFASTSVNLSYKSGTNYFITSQPIITSIYNIPYYARVERINGTTLMLSIFSNSQRTNHITGSPILMCIPLTILTNLNIVQHANDVNANSMTSFTGTIDNVCIKNGPNTLCPLNTNFAFVQGNYCAGQSISISSETPDIGSGVVTNYWMFYETDTNCNEIYNPNFPISDYGNSLAMTLNPAIFLPGHCYEIKHQIYSNCLPMCEEKKCFCIAPATVTTVASACGNFTWYGTTYTVSGIYTHSFINSSGCASSEILNLSITQTMQTTININTSNSYTWFVNGITYTSSGTYTINLISSSGCDSIIILNLTITQFGTTLNLTCFIEGYWNGINEMVPVLSNQGQASNIGDCDSIDVELHDAFSPYTVVASTRTVLHQNGTAVCNFLSVNGNYYIVVKGRNMLEGWSALPISFANPIVNYDFSTSSLQTYGENCKHIDDPWLVWDFWAFYSGDINQDENADLLDQSLLEFDIANFNYGYFATDLNGDGNVDLLDSPILDVNINNFIYSNHP